MTLVQAKIFYMLQRNTIKELRKIRFHVNECSFQQKIPFRDCESKPLGN